MMRLFVFAVLALVATPCLAVDCSDLKTQFSGIAPNLPQKLKGIVEILGPVYRISVEDALHMSRQDVLPVNIRRWIANQPSSSLEKAQSEGLVALAYKVDFSTYQKLLQEGAIKINYISVSSNYTHDPKNIFNMITRAQIGKIWEGLDSREVVLMLDPQVLAGVTYHLDERDHDYKTDGFSVRDLFELKEMRVTQRLMSSAQDWRSLGRVGITQKWGWLPIWALKGVVTAKKPVLEVSGKSEYANRPIRLQLPAAISDLIAIQDVDPRLPLDAMTLKKIVHSHEAVDWLPLMGYRLKIYYKWGVFEGEVTSIHPKSKGTMALSFSDGKKSLYVPQAEVFKIEILRYSPFLPSKNTVNLTAAELQEPETRAYINSLPENLYWTVEIVP